MNIGFKFSGFSVFMILGEILQSDLLQKRIMLPYAEKLGMELKEERGNK